ncbi:MAG: hypothetical protein EBY16_03915 [Gammaproteobacteria bacterium]|nr:hypothetical protein [Gammaproteobacteria bacterium]
MKQAAEQPKTFADIFIEYFRENAGTSKILKTNLGELLKGNRQYLGRLFNDFIPLGFMTADECELFFEETKEFGFLYTYSKTLQPLLDRMIDYRNGTVSDEFMQVLNSIEIQSQSDASNYDTILKKIKITPAEFAVGIANSLRVPLKSCLGDRVTPGSVNCSKVNILDYFEKALDCNKLMLLNKWEYPQWHIASTEFKQSLNSLPPLTISNEVTDLRDFLTMILDENFLPQMEEQPHEFIQLRGELSYYALKNLKTAIEEDLKKQSSADRSKLPNLLQNINAIVTEMEDTNSFFDKAWEKIGKDFFQIAELDGIKVPKELMATGEYSRSLEYIAEAKDVELTKPVVDAYIANVTKHGYEYADAITMNDFIEKIVDFKQSKLQETFINRIGGQEIYQSMLDKCMQLNGCSPEKAALYIANSFKNAVPTLFFAAIQKYKETLDQTDSTQDEPDSVIRAKDELDSVIRAQNIYGQSNVLRFDYYGLEPKDIQSKINIDGLNDDFDEFYNEFHEKSGKDLPPNWDEFSLTYQKLYKIYTLFQMKNEASKKLLSDKELPDEMKEHYFKLLISANLLLSQHGYTLTHADNVALIYLQNKQQIYTILALGALILSLAASVAVLFLTHGLTAPVIVPLIGKEISAIVAISATAGAALASLASLAGTIMAFLGFKQKYHQYNHQNDNPVETQENSVDDPLVHQQHTP